MRAQLPSASFNDFNRHRIGTRFSAKYLYFRLPELQPPRHGRIDLVLALDFIRISDGSDIRRECAVRAGNNFYLLTRNSLGQTIGKDGHKGMSALPWELAPESECIDHIEDLNG